MLVDSSIVVELFRHKRTSKFFRDIMKRLGEQLLFVSLIELAEVADWCLRNSIPPEGRITAITEFAQIIPLDEAICKQSYSFRQGPTRLESVSPSLGKCS